MSRSAYRLPPFALSIRKGLLPFFVRHRSKIFLGVFLGILLLCGSFSYPLPLPGERPHFYLHPSSYSLRRLFLQAIHSSKESLFLAMFGISDPKILEALQKKSPYILYDPRHSALLTPLFPPECLDPVQGPGLMHHKICILDHKMVLCGSTNFTPPSLKMHDNLVVGLYSPEMASFLERQLPFSGSKKFLVGGQPIDVWLLPDGEGHALNAVLSLLASAKKSLYLSLFAITHPKLIEALLSAHDRGVQVTLVLDASARKGSSKKGADLLEKRGATLKKPLTTALHHHKLCLIDETILITGSANWTRAAFQKNYDLLLILYDLSPTQLSCLHKIRSVY